MLGILLIYWIGRSFYNLAELSNKSPWGFAIAGIGVYYGVQLVLGVLMHIFLDVETMSYEGVKGLDLSAAFVGGIATYGFYQYVKKEWSKPQERASDPDILDDIV